jgi:hypothetical protein
LSRDLIERYDMHIFNGASAQMYRVLLGAYGIAFNRDAVPKTDIARIALKSGKNSRDKGECVG